MEDLNAAASFVWENNKACPVWPDPCFSFLDVKEHILADIRAYAAKNMATYDDPDKWISWVGGAGYWFIFSSDDEMSIDVEILVDPALGNNKYSYVHEVID